MAGTLHDIHRRIGATVRVHLDGGDAYPRMRLPDIDWMIHLGTILLSVLILAPVIIQPWIEPKWLFLDPLTAAELSESCCRSYYGFISLLGVMLWVAAAAICLFAAVLLLAARRTGEVLIFALSAGLLTGWLALDDAFLLHERVLPGLGIPQNAILAAYVLLAIGYLIANYRVLLASDFWLLLAGGGALAFSMLVDVVFHSLDPNMVLLEDSMKFVGICAWAAFHISAMAKILILDRGGRI